MTEEPTSVTSTWTFEPRQTLKRGQVDFHTCLTAGRGAEPNRLRAVPLPQHALRGRRFEAVGRATRGQSLHQRIG